MASCFPPSEFDGRLLAYNPSEGHWQNYPSETQQQNYKLLIAQNHSNEGVSLYLVPTDKHFPEKILLVDDLASSSFRFKLSKDIFIQWTYKGDAFGFQCKNKDIANQINVILEDIKTSVRLRPHKSSSNGDISNSKKNVQDVETAETVSLRSSYSSRSVHSLKDEQDEPNQTHSEHSGDEERPLQRVNQFQPTSTGKRRNSTKKHDALKRTNSKVHEENNIVPNAATSNANLVKAIETLRQSSQRDRQQLSDKIDFLQNRIEEVMSLLTAQNSLLHDLKNREFSVPAPSNFSVPPSAPSSTACNKPANLGVPPPPPTSSNPTPASNPPPPPPPPMQGGGPPPPPPPPPAFKSTDNRSKTLAEQLAEAKMKKDLKSSNGSNSAPDPVPKAMGTIDFSTELQNRIKKRTGNPIIN